LNTILTDCLDNAVARAVLVVADAGTGKSRLRHEFLRRVATLHPDLLVLSGFGDVMAAGSAYGLLRQILNSLCGILDGEDKSTSRNKLAQRAAGPVAPFLGELCGLAFPDDDNVRLKAARQDPLIMAQRIHEAFVEFVATECAQRPMLLVLEDLQWSDRLTVRLVDAALRLRDRRLMILALARPEVEDTFPKLWSGAAQVIPLRPLSKRPCERLVTEVLGKDAPKATVERLIEQSAGNPFYLEELIRAVAEGQGGNLPGTVMAMLNARLMRLESGARRALRAASVFGEIFWRGGLSTLLGGERNNELIQPWLDQLVKAELIEPRGKSRLAEETEYRFRHALTREAAYSMLIDADRSLGHRLAARFLEHAGERDPLVVAEHYERGEEPARAVPFYLRAAERVFWGGDGDTAVTYARRCLKLDAQGPDRLACLSILLSVHGFRADYPACSQYVEEILHHAPPDCPILGQPLAFKGMLEMMAGRTAAAIASMSQLLDLPPVPNPFTLFGLMVSTYHFDQISHFDLAEKSLQRLERIVGPLASSDPGSWVWLALSHTSHAKNLGEAHSGLIWARDGRTAALAAGNRRMAHSAQAFSGMHLWLLGRWAPASQELQEALAVGPELGPVFGQAMAYLILSLAAQGELAQAQGMAEQFIDTVRQRDMHIEEGLGRWALCDVLGRLGDLAAAEAQARQACRLLQVVSLDQLLARIWLADILLRSGGSAQALALSEEVMAQYRALGGRGLKLTLARLIYAESLSAVGRTEEARAVLAESCTFLQTQANAILDPQLRSSFLQEVPENARTLALHRANPPSA
jgi:tetratricopeptide (TPR) repeat protein